MLLNRILVYNPLKRLFGTELLNDNFFDDIFKSEAKRLGSKSINIFTLAVGRFLIPFKL